MMPESCYNRLPEVPMRFSMRSLPWSTTLAAHAGVAALGGCNPAEGLCQKEYDCQEELGLSLEDDYVAVCAAGHEGANRALRANAEKECEDLANAQVALAGCESVLDCETLAKSRGAPLTDDDSCKDLRQSLVDALGEAEGGAACDGVDDVAAEGEGEGE